MVHSDEKPLDEKDYDDAARLVKQRQRHLRRALPAGEFVNRLLARKGYAQTGSANELTKVWDDVVGEKWKTRTQAGNISRGVLEITVASPAISQHLTLTKNQLLKKLQTRLPQNKIRDIKFRIGNIS